LDKQQAVFEKFVQADSSSTRKYGGTGLGLTISAQLVEMMGGKIWLVSEPGKGSIFHFTVTMGISACQDQEDVHAKVEALDGLPVLVVDDNLTNLHILEKMLSNWGIMPVPAVSGSIALTILKQAAELGRPFGLVVLDAHMPDMDGFMLARQIKEDPRCGAASLMLLTSGGQGGDGARCRELGVSAYLPKPVGEGELLDAIRRVLHLSTAKQRQPELVTRHVLQEGKRRLHLLVVEDNPVNLLLATRLIENHGYTFTTAENGQIALEVLQKENIDCVLMDVQMPVMDGLETTRAIREKERGIGGHLPIVAMTAHSMAGDREGCLAAGMDDYISKPIRAKELFATLDRVLAPGPRMEPTQNMPEQVNCPIPISIESPVSDRV
jgi:CheY-like chemotaxis protein